MKRPYMGRLGQLSTGTTRWPIVIIAIILLVLAATAATVVVTLRSGDCGRDPACFITRAQQCDDATLRSDIANGTIIKYVTHDCTLTKTIDSVGPDESPDVAQYFEGKSMRCPYTAGSFDNRTIDGLSIEGCSGTLRDAILDLKTARQLDEAQ